MKENNNPTLAVFGKSKKIHSTIVDAIFKKNHLSTDKIKDNLEVTEEMILISFEIHWGQIKVDRLR